jgi:hypothetical protein
MSLFQAKVPVAMATGLICLLVGGGLGAAIVGYSQSKPEQFSGPAEGEAAAADAKGPNEKAKGNKGGGKGGNKKGGARGPSPKAQLAQLVDKLDALTRQSLHVELNAEQKKQVKEALAGLGEKEEVSDEEATAKLDALHKLLEGQRLILEAAGYRWPGGGGGGGPPGAPPPPNPFAVGENAKHLKSLEATLGK